MDVRAQMLVFSRILRALTEVLGLGIRANDPRMSAGYPSPKLPLWADFSFLIRLPRLFFDSFSRAGKNNKLNFCGRKWPVWDFLFTRRGGIEQELLVSQLR